MLQGVLGNWWLWIRMAHIIGGLIRALIFENTDKKIQKRLDFFFFLIQRVESQKIQLKKMLVLHGPLRPSTAVLIYNCSLTLGWKKHTSNDQSTLNILELYRSWETCPYFWRFSPDNECFLVIMHWFISLSTYKRSFCFGEIIIITDNCALLGPMWSPWFQL